MLNRGKVIMERIESLRNKHSRMKKQRKELDVDFIQSKPLTKEEEQKLSEYIKKLKSEVF